MNYNLIYIYLISKYNTIMNNTDKDNNSTIEKSLDKDKNDENKRDLTRRGYGRINEEIKEENKLEKIKAPKRRYAIIHGYVGHNYSGNQKYYLI